MYEFIGGALLAVIFIGGAVYLFARSNKKKAQAFADSVKEDIKGKL